MSMLEVRDLSVRCGSAAIVNDVSFSVEPGDWLMLVGPNGAGKSTIVNAVSRGVPYTGEVRFKGRDIRKIPPNVLARGMGVLSQQHAVGYAFTVAEVVRLGRYAYAPGIFASHSDEDERRVAEAMERTGVAVVAKDKGTCRGITLRDLAIHDVNGNVYDKHMNNGGIYMTALSPADEAATGPARFADVLVEGCYLYRVSRWGLAVGYTYAHAHFQGAALEEAPFLKYGHENVTIRDNYVKLAGGDGITVMYALRPLVEHNTADSVACEINDRVYSHPGDRAGKVAAGIWPWKHSPDPGQHGL